MCWNFRGSWRISWAISKVISNVPLPSRIKFAIIYRLNLWGSTESVSGPGSTLNYTTKLRPQLKKLVDEFAFKKVLDAPCGDFNWIKELVLEKEIEYTGCDIVASIVKKNKLIAPPNAKFFSLDVCSDVLPTADLLICRDLLIHLSDFNILKFLRNYQRSNIPYLLISTYPSGVVAKNQDVSTGGFRYVNLNLYPWLFPEKALKTLQDFVNPFPPRQLNLYSRDMVPSFEL